MIAYEIPVEKYNKYHQDESNNNIKMNAVHLSILFYEYGLELCDLLYKRLTFQDVRKFCIFKFLYRIGPLAFYDNSSEFERFFYLNLNLVSVAGI